MYVYIQKDLLQLFPSQMLLKPLKSFLLLLFLKEEKKDPFEACTVSYTLLPFALSRSGAGAKPRRVSPLQLLSLINKYISEHGANNSVSEQLFSFCWRGGGHDHLTVCWFMP